MESGAGGSREDGPTSSGPVRGLAEATLLRALERVSEVNDEGMRPAVHAFVDALVQEGVAPEAAVIALKDAFNKAHFLNRFEPLVREQMRSACVSECIDHYFAIRPADDARPRSAEAARRTPDGPRTDDTGASTGA